MNSVYLSIGSNLGDRRINLEKAVSLLAADNDTVQSVSHVYETEPWGNPDQPKFYNQAVELSSELEPFEFLNKIHSIENICGRLRSPERYGPRTLDIDILFFNDLILTSDSLKIPHPLVHERLFVLAPMADIAPGLRHPVLGKTIRQLLKRCGDETKVVRIF